MTQIYVDPQRADQAITLSDISHCQLTVETHNGEVRYRFSFAEHKHTGFWIAGQLTDKMQVNVQGVEGLEHFQINFR